MKKVLIILALVLAAIHPVYAADTPVGFVNDDVITLVTPEKVLQEGVEVAYGDFDSKVKASASVIYFQSNIDLTSPPSGKIKFESSANDMEYSVFWTGKVWRLEMPSELEEGEVVVCDGVYRVEYDGVALHIGTNTPQEFKDLAGIRWIVLHGPDGEVIAEE